MKGTSWGIFLYKWKNSWTSNHTFRKKEINITTIVRKKKYRESYMEVMEVSVKEMVSSDTQQLYMKETSSYYMVADKTEVQQFPSCLPILKSSSGKIKTQTKPEHWKRRLSFFSLGCVIVWFQILIVDYLWKNVEVTKASSVKGIFFPNFFLICNTFTLFCLLWNKIGFFWLCMKFMS